MPGTNGKSNKGENVTVEPIRELKDIDAIKKLLADEPRNHLLFVMGINNGIRTGDLVKLKINQVRSARPGSEIRIRENKTGKMNVVKINKAVHKSLVRYLATKDHTDEDYLFRSRKGNWHLSTTAVNNLVKKWTAAINLPGRYGAHTLRKTFGLIQRTKFGVGFDVLCKRFNHSSPAVTQRYLGITEREVSRILMAKRNPRPE